MAKYEVIEMFRDKDTHEVHAEGTHYETDDLKRAEFLQSHGYIGDEVEFTDDNDADDGDLIPLGGGMYELPDGEKVKGKAKALKALEEQKTGEYV
jgi:hypothetical protein